MEDLHWRIVEGASNHKRKGTCSSWWANLVSIESGLSEEVFNRGCKFVVSNGFSTPFWYLSWTDAGILKDSFSSVYAISLLQVVSCAAMGEWRDERWFWGDLGIPASSMHNSAYAVEKQRQETVLEHALLTAGSKDQHRWDFGDASEYSVANCYKIIAGQNAPYDPLIVLTKLLLKFGRR